MSLLARILVPTCVAALLFALLPALLLAGVASFCLVLLLVKGAANSPISRICLWGLWPYPVGLFGLAAAKYSGVPGLFWVALGLIAGSGLAPLKQRVLSPEELKAQREEQERDRLANEATWKIVNSLGSAPCKPEAGAAPRTAVAQPQHQAQPRPQPVVPQQNRTPAVLDEYE